MIKQLQKRAFTLIELLVVIAIIGILASLIIVSLSGARSKATDTQLKNNARNLDTALAQYYQDQPTAAYPVATTQIYNTSAQTTAPGAGVTGYDFIPSGTLATGLGAYLSGGTSSAVFTFNNVSAGYITTAAGAKFALATGLKSQSEGDTGGGNGIYSTTAAGLLDDATYANLPADVATIGTWTESTAFTGSASNNAFVVYGPQ